MKNLFSLFSGNPMVLKIASAVVFSAMAVRAIVAPHTVAFQVTDGIIDAGILLGLTSAVEARSKK